MRTAILSGLGAVAAAGVIAMACTQAVGTDACKQIEQARCYWIEQCFADAGPTYGLPVSPSNGMSPVDECFRYYDDACGHGLVTNVQPTSDEVNACVKAINAATDCTIVQAPETSDACAFLTYDAGTDADASDDGE